MKKHDLYILDDTIRYFYTKEKRDRNGNSRFRIYIIDTENGEVFERVSTCYEFQIPEVMKHYTNNN